MCIAILKPEGVLLSNKIFSNSFGWHSDGAGFISFNPETKEYVNKKGFFTLEDFLKSYKPYERNLCLIHFRKSTGGSRNEENCHPFMLNENLGFVHNGMISIDIENEAKSDTWHFNEMLKGLVNKNPDLLKNKAFISLLERYIGYSKIVFLNSDGEAVFLNKQLGITSVNNVWYSNNTYRHDINNIGTYCFDKELLKRFEYSYKMKDEDKKASLDDIINRVEFSDSALNYVENLWNLEIA
jgi:predicted glutamine amidotransferase